MTNCEKNLNINIYLILFLNKLVMYIFIDINYCTYFKKLI
jgi:hypothetical protein